MNTLLDMGRYTINLLLTKICLCTFMSKQLLFWHMASLLIKKSTLSSTVLTKSDNVSVR